MFKVKNSFLKMTTTNGKRGWSGTLKQWNMVREYELTWKSIKALDYTMRKFNEIWR